MKKIIITDSLDVYTFDVADDDDFEKYMDTLEVLDNSGVAYVVITPRSSK